MDTLKDMVYGYIKIFEALPDKNDKLFRIMKEIVYPYAAIMEAEQVEPLYTNLRTEIYEEFYEYFTNHFGLEGHEIYDDKELEMTSEMIMNHENPEVIYNHLKGYLGWKFGRKDRLNSPFSILLQEYIPIIKKILYTLLQLGRGTYDSHLFIVFVSTMFELEQHKVSKVFGPLIPYYLERKGIGVVVKYKHIREFEIVRNDAISLLPGIREAEIESLMQVSNRRIITPIDQ